LGLEVRLRQLELKMNSWSSLPEHSVNTDEVIRHLVFDPASLRESAHHMGNSVVETMCEIIGIEPREFEHILREKVNLTR